jgi:hypothetical protein
MTEQQTTLVLCFNEDTGHWLKVRVPVSAVGLRPTDEAVCAALLRRGLDMGRRIEVANDVKCICMVETTDERQERRKKRRRRLLERELEIDLAGWRK